MRSKSKGFSGISSALIGIMVAVIIGVAVTLNVVIDMTNNTNATGTALTIIRLLPVGVALVLLVAVFGVVSR